MTESKIKKINRLHLGYYDLHIILIFLRGY